MAYQNIITYGTFDVFHYGHYYLLERASALGNHLTVFVSTDRFNDLKGKKAKFPYAERARIIQNLVFVNAVFPEDSWEQKIQDIKNLNIDLFVMGDDWKGKFDYLKDYCNVLYLPRTKGISSSEVRSQI